MGVEFGRVAARAGLDQGYSGAGPGEFGGERAPGGAGADNADVELLLCHGWDFHGAGSPVAASTFHGLTRDDRCSSRAYKGR